MIDIKQHANAVRRQVGTRALDAGEARTVVISGVYDTTAEDLWDTCTNADRLARWFVPVRGDLRLGGRFQVEGNAAGTIEQCDPPKSFASTWEIGEQASWLEVRLTPERQDATRLELTHITLPDDHWDQFGPGAVGIGWDLTFLGLAQHVASGGAAADPAQFVAWMGSADGREFIQHSGRQWTAAHIASGDDEAVARAMGERTITAYTAPPPA